jgi:hypothetical protein
VNLDEMRAERDRLDAEIAAAEKKERAHWNMALDGCECALGEWLRKNSVEWQARERKNEETWDIGHGALTVTFGQDDGEHGRGLSMASGQTLTLEWSAVPEPERLISVVAVLLGRSNCGHLR